MDKNTCIANRLIKSIEKRMNLLLNDSYVSPFIKQDLRSLNNTIHLLVFNTIKPMQERIDKITISRCVFQTNKSEKECIDLLKNKRQLNEYYKESE